MRKKKLLLIVHLLIVLGRIQGNSSFLVPPIGILIIVSRVAAVLRWPILIEAITSQNLIRLGGRIRIC